MLASENLKKQREKSWNALMLANSEQWHTRKSIYQYHDEIYRNHQALPKMQQYQSIATAHV